jgi:hypothetical protein
MRWLREYGEKGRHLETAALIIVMLLTLLYYVTTSGITEVSQTQGHIMDHNTCLTSC